MTEKGYGVLQALQSYIFEKLKKHFPGFIHSMTSKQIVALAKSRIGPNWKSISIDGSAFDSSQFLVLMALVDDAFFRGIKPFILKIVRHWVRNLPSSPTRTAEELAEVILENLLQNKFDLFVNVPGVNGPKWSQATLDNFKRDIQGSNKWL